MLKLFDIVRAYRGYREGNPLKVLRLPLLHLHTCNCIVFIMLYLHTLLLHLFIIKSFISIWCWVFCPGYNAFLFYSDAFIFFLSSFPHPFFSSFLPSCDISRDYYLSYCLSVLALHLISFELFNFFVRKSMLCKNYYFYFIYSTIYLLVCLLIYYLRS